MRALINHVVLVCVSFAFNEAGAAAVRDFVASGGVILACSVTGTRDGHGKPRKQPALADLFRKGRKQTAGDCAYTVAPFGKGYAFALLKPDVIAYKALRARGRGADEPLKRMMLRVLESAGTRMSAVRTYVFHDGAGSLYVGFLRSPGGPGPRTAKASLVLGRKMFVYNVRAGRFPGHTKRAPVTLQRNGRGELLAMLPYRLGGIEIETDKPRYARGDVVKLRIAPVTAGGGRATGTHVLRMEFTGPRGKTHKPYRRNVLLRGRGPVEPTLKLALDEPKGKWSVRVTDVSTGVSAKTVYTVR